MKKIKQPSVKEVLTASINNLKNCLVIQDKKDFVQVKAEDVSLVIKCLEVFVKRYCY